MTPAQVADMVAALRALRRRGALICGHAGRGCGCPRCALTALLEAQDGTPPT